MAVATSADLTELPQQVKLFPRSRYMGSKQALLPFLHSVFEKIEFNSALDAFSGSGSVSYLLKAMGKEVRSNDFLALGYHDAVAMVVNQGTRLDAEEISRIQQVPPVQGFISETFRGLYFDDDDNAFLDGAVHEVSHVLTEPERSLHLAALARACKKRRPRGLFTYTGVRYQDGRRDLQLSLREHYGMAARMLNRAVFEGAPCHASRSDIFELQASDVDLVYFDPPYVSDHSDNDYTRRYHFVEGLLRGWVDLEIQAETSTKKFKRIPSRFDSKATVRGAFEDLFRKYSRSKLALSYSSNGIPTKEELVEMLYKFKTTVTVYEQEHLYSFGNQGHRTGRNRNAVKEYLFLAE